MSKKFSIIESLNEVKLRNGIIQHVNENEEDPYIFMNRKTIDDLEYAAPLGSYEKFNSCEIKMKCGVIAMYRGFKIYENNDLKYGEVELR